MKTRTLLYSASVFTLAIVALQAADKIDTKNLVTGKAAFADAKDLKPGTYHKITAADLPDHTGGDKGMYDILENCMARGTAFYDGHAVAAVAAIDANTARQALKLIKVDYEVLPHVTDVDEAMKPSAPVLHKDMFTEGVEPKPAKPSNVAKRSEYGHGDIEAGMREADVVISRTFKTEQTHQGYIEPHACVARSSEDGQVTVWTTTQAPFLVRDACAGILGLSASQIKVIPSEVLFFKYSSMS